MSWKATLDGAQIKQFRLALQCCSKIGSELLIEATPDKLILRSLNTAKSAFVAISFHNDFFDAHAVSQAPIVKGSVLIKHALVLMRTQRIQKLVLQMDTFNEQRLIGTVISESGLQKEYRMPCVETEILHANVERDQLPTTVVAAAKELNKLLSSFQISLEEVTIIALPGDMHNGQTSNAVQLHSYLDPSKRKQEAVLHTQISVNTDAVFVSYTHAAAEVADVTFNLRDFRVMLGWCAAMDLDVAIRFEGPGSPLLVEPSNLHRGTQVEAQLVVATLLESQAHRATARQQPGTLGPTGMRSALRTPGAATDSPGTGNLRTGSINGGPARAAAATGARRTRFAPENQRQPQFETPRRAAGDNEAAEAAGEAVGSFAARGEFTLDEKMEAATLRNEDSHLQIPRMRTGTELNESARPSRSHVPEREITGSQAKRLRGTGLLDDTEEGGPEGDRQPGNWPLTSGFAGSQSQSAQQPDSFEDDDLEDRSCPILRHVPLGFLATPNDEDEEDPFGIPDTP